MYFFVVKLYIFAPESCFSVTVLIDFSFHKYEFCLYVFEGETAAQPYFKKPSRHLPGDGHENPLKSQLGSMPAKVPAFLLHAQNNRAVV